MKSFLLLLLQLAFVTFSMSAIMCLVNFLFGWHLGLKGETAPADPYIAGLSLLLAVISGGGFLYLNRRR